ncbi:UDP-N-acetylmuramoyl-L-alanyl-D-glutamate--2,6-diaminopimelate ligase [Novimethylophilus kurashikiensis]|uniref:UDP-N-acetylmuramoyl-L-alanyl-D-glutamate--2,6-diaminopimelate ligase n=1 Tax=Novimethylophilus kurashikiensis TaxID=1825523 RepID=A0A2R5FAU7_9PROT|nr:UDP-N-acetylmuramoyl-L-alanyl-D-glutamate--2,6-diaminopimelate ligase [Novimethylophilus kurashikiensis]GBG15360.1 UDP-N-acetylmuramoyl-L-alanyl-D-glutamate--2,6-diaminopimelate ligase [Novimethylophilus kurashikiensis]
MSVIQQLLDVGIQPKRLVSDSRQVQAGDVFLAYAGESADGRQYINAAIEHGAAAVVWEADGYAWPADCTLPNIPVIGLRGEVSRIAGEYFGMPSQALWMVGITGTNGKTSCSHWLAQCLSRCGKPTALIGTLGNGFPQALQPSPNTTPDPILLQAQLADYRQQGANAVAMEVSSHGLAQGRVNGVHFDVAVLTNLSRDHLDYHGSMEDYAAAKAQLFDWPDLKCAVVNADDAFGVRIAAEQIAQGRRVLTYGFEQGDVRGSALSLDETGIAMAVMTPWGEGQLDLPVLGRFNACNALAVLATLLVSDVPLQQAIDVMREIRPVAGRMQQLGGDELPLVVVDYAHTPDALEKVLLSLREQCRGQLICVFGCGGNRDKGKRPLMGGVVSRLADLAFVTSDNPRHENGREIINEIVAGMDADYRIEEDRAAAIDAAIREAKAGDIVLLAGKGHESYQQIGDEKLPFSDLEVAQRVLDSMRRSS